MWFNPLAPEPASVEPQPAAAEKSKPDEKLPTSNGAPIKEAEAIVPKPEVPKLVVLPPNEQLPTISHNL